MHREGFFVALKKLSRGESPSLLGDYRTVNQWTSEAANKLVTFFQVQSISDFIEAKKIINNLIAANSKKKNLTKWQETKFHAEHAQARSHLLLSLASSQNISTLNTQKNPFLKNH